MILPIVRVLTVVCWIMCVRNTVSQAPTLNFVQGVNPNNIALRSLVQLNCALHRHSPYPLTVSIGKLENSSQTPETTAAWLTSEVIQAGSMYFTVPASDQFEGKIVCWYTSTQTSQKNPYSEFSNSVNFVVSALSPPNVTVNPAFFLEGENYTVSCNVSRNTWTNFTLTMFYRVLPVTPGTNWTSLGSVFLTDNDSIFLRQNNIVVPVEYACSMEMVYKEKVLHSPLSTTKAIPESLPVQLYEQERGETCLGYLYVKRQLQWSPVCQKEISTDADSLAAEATASVVCRNLGCGHVLHWQRIDTKQFTNTIEDIRCSGKENKIKDCPFNVTESCKQGGVLYIICSDALPSPKLSVVSRGPVSKVYVTDKQNVEISCFINSTSLKSQDYGYYVFRRNGELYKEIYSRPIYPESITQFAPVNEGAYECRYRLDFLKTSLLSQPSNTIFIYIYNPPNPGPIVAGVLTTLIGIAILTYMCVYRAKKENVQSNEIPAHSQDPETTQNTTESPQNNASYLPQQM